MLWTILFGACLRLLSLAESVDGQDRNAIYIQPLSPISTWFARQPIQWTVTYERLLSKNLSWSVQPSWIHGQSSDDNRGADADQMGGGVAVSLRKYPLRDSAEAIYIGPKLEFQMASYDSPAWIERKESFSSFMAPPRTYPARSGSVVETRLLLMLGYRSKWDYFCAYLDAGLGVGKASLGGDRSVFPDSYLDYTDQAFRYDFDFGMGIPF